MSKAPVAVSKIIECVNVAVVSDSAYTNGKSGYDKEIESFGDCFVTEDMKEGTTAFLKKKNRSLRGSSFVSENIADPYRSAFLCPPR